MCLVRNLSRANSRTRHNLSGRISHCRLRLRCLPEGEAFTKSRKRVHEQLSMQRKLRGLIVTIGITMRTSPLMAETQCTCGTGIYRNVLNPHHEIAFHSPDSGSITPKAGQTRLTFAVAQWISNGFPRVLVGIGPTVQKRRATKVLHPV
jgi:hypothetical protein